MRGYKQLQLTINKLPKHLDKDMINAAGMFYGNVVFGKKLFPYIDVDVEFNTNLIRGQHKEGYCEWDDKPISPRAFTIMLDGTMREKRMLIAFAHEIVHVKQMARNETTTFAKGGCLLERWHGKPVNHKKIDYWDLPWEIEAHGRELGLYTRFMIDWDNKHE